MTVTTLADAETVFGASHLEHLDRSAALPVITRAACQGDVSIRCTGDAADVPAGAAIPAAGVVVISGGTGGHAHTLFGDGPAGYAATPARTGSLELGTLTVPAGSRALLSHPEHGGLLIDPGTYVLGRQREYAGEWRAVAD